VRLNERESLFGEAREFTTLILLLRRGGRKVAEAGSPMCMTCTQVGMVDAISRLHSLTPAVWAAQA
jgi:hypothetical protein